MKLRLLISISLAALAIQTVRAESADEFFNSGAQSYLSNNVDGAKQLVEKGLKVYPDDIKLKKLEELLKQQQQQQQKQDQQQQKQNQSQSKQNQQQKSQQQKQNQQKQNQEQKKQQPEPQKDRRHQEKQDEQKKKGEQTPPGQMTPEEAKQLLDSQKADESLLPYNRNQKHDREHPLKDW